MAEGPAGIVTGAASGIGRAVAAEFARNGCRVVLTDVSPSALEKAVTELTDDGFAAIGHAADIRESEQMAHVVSAALDAFGQIDFLVACAGIADQSLVSDGDPARWKAVIETNVLGTMVSVRSVLPTMIEQHSGHIMLVASMSGRDVYVGEPSYIASKWGVVGFGHALRLEVEPSNIRVTLVEPGIVDTPLTRDNPKVAPKLDELTPLRPEDVAAALSFAYQQPAHVCINEIAMRPLGQMMNRIGASTKST